MSAEAQCPLGLLEFSGGSLLPQRESFLFSVLVSKFMRISFHIDVFSIIEWLYFQEPLI